LLSIEDGAQDSRVLVPLVERRQFHGVKSLVLVVRIGLDGVVVYPNPLVGVSDGDVERHVVVERVVVGGGEIEARERGVGDVELEVVGAEDEPDDEHGEANDYEDREDDFENETEDAVAEAAEKAPAAAAAATATAVAVVGFTCRWD